MKILIIEDEYNLADAISSMLKSKKYSTEIKTDGNASESELEIGNIITEIDNNKITSIETIRIVLNKKEKGDTVTLKVKYASRNEYKEKEINITLN